MTYENFCHFSSVTPARYCRHWQTHASSPSSSTPATSSTSYITSTSPPLAGPSSTLAATPLPLESTFPSFSSSAPPSPPRRASTCRSAQLTTWLEIYLLLLLLPQLCIGGQHVHLGRMVGLGHLQDDCLVVLHPLLGHVVNGAQLSLIDWKCSADGHDAGQG